MKISIAILFAAALLTACGDARGPMTEARRDQLCGKKYGALPHVGSWVVMKMNGKRVQVIESGYNWWREPTWSQYDKIPKKFCSYIVIVRVDLHGIALDGGSWPTAKPEVWPTIAVRMFEFTDEN